MYNMNVKFGTRGDSINAETLVKAATAIGKWIFLVLVQTRSFELQAPEKS